MSNTSEWESIKKSLQTWLDSCEYGEVSLVIKKHADRQVKYSISQTRSYLNSQELIDDADTICY